MLPLMIFAAGKGTRMGALTRTRPKPLIDVAGQSLLDRALIMAGAANPTRIVVNTHYLGDQITDHLAGTDIAISDEADELLETGGGLRKALPLLGDGAVMTLNPDVIWTGPNPLCALQAAWRPKDMDALLMLIDHAHAFGRVGPGDFSLGDHGLIVRQGQWVYGGCQIINPALLSRIEKRAFSLNVLWDEMIAGGRCFGIVHRGGWCDLGRPETIPIAERMLAEHVG